LAGVNLVIAVVGLRLVAADRPLSRPR